MPPETELFGHWTVMIWRSGSNRRGRVKIYAAENKFDAEKLIGNLQKIRLRHGYIRDEIVQEIS